MPVVEQKEVYGKAMASENNILLNINFSTQMWKIAPAIASSSSSVAAKGFTRRSALLLLLLLW